MGLNNGCFLKPGCRGNFWVAALWPVSELAEEWLGICIYIYSHIQKFTTKCTCDHPFCLEPSHTFTIATQIRSLAPHSIHNLQKVHVLFL